MTTSLVGPSAVISGAQVQRALEWREQQIVELVEAARRPHAAGETVTPAPGQADLSTAHRPA